MLDVVDTGKHLIAVGDHGHILASNDGLNWAQVDVPVRSTLTAVSFPDSENGWAVGHDAVILHTVDGGRTWTLQNFEPEREKPFLDVLFLDARRGFAVGAYGLFYATTDGGSAWTEVNAPAVRTDELHLYSIARLANGALLVSGEQGLLAISNDAGKSWRKLASPSELTLFGIVPHGARGAVVCGLRGTVFAIDDVTSGKWKPVITGTKDSFFGCSSLGDQHIALTGLNGAVLVLTSATGTVTSLRGGDEGTYSGVAKWGDALILAGEQGMRRLSMSPGIR